MNLQRLASLAAQPVSESDKPAEHKPVDVNVGHVKAAHDRHVGGGNRATHLTLDDGQVLIITPEHVLLYKDAEAADRGDPEDVAAELDR